jgi:glycosyltransferase involved in cell wall biosynthesis
MTAGWAALALIAYTGLGYPLLLVLFAPRRRPPRSGQVRRWPSISITLSTHNGGAELGPTLEALLAEPYPGPRQILVVSDGSTDATAGIVSGYASRGVELLALPERVGKTEGENRALDRLTGEIIINTDATVVIRPGAIVALVEAMEDPEVGVASSRDLSIDRGAPRNQGERGYVGYEMWLRDLETAMGGIVGASGSLYAVRGGLHRRRLPGHLSRDFAVVLHARERGYRAVAVPEAVCIIPRGAGGRHEYRRKVRTMARGLATLGAHRRLLDPFRYGRFAWMLLSHKLLRWTLPPVVGGALVVELLSGRMTGWGYGVALAGAAAAALGWWWPGGAPPRMLAIPASAAGAVVAGIAAWWVALTGGAQAVWEPTRRRVTTLPVDRSSPGRSAT